VLLALERLAAHMGGERVVGIDFHQLGPDLPRVVDFAEMAERGGKQGAGKIGVNVGSRFENSTTRSASAASFEGRLRGLRDFLFQSDLCPELYPGLRRCRWHLQYCATPSTAKVRKVAYLLPIFSCASRAASRHALTLSMFSNWRMTTRSAGGWPVIEKVLLNPPAMDLPPLSSIAFCAPGRKSFLYPSSSLTVISLIT